jgi:Rrf2 family nitric oxide-sensitive transcriptional repressor
MQLTPMTDHAFRVLIYLSDRYMSAQPSRPATILELSMQLGIPVNATQKVATRLGQIGLIAGHRGRQGGILLDRPPAKLSLGWLYRQIEVDLAAGPSLRGHGAACSLIGYSRLGEILQQSLQFFIAELDRFTLADLASDPELLRRLHNTNDNER